MRANNERERVLASDFECDVIERLSINKEKLHEQKEGKSMELFCRRTKINLFIYLPFLMSRRHHLSHEAPLTIHSRQERLGRWLMHLNDFGGLILLLCSVCVKTSWEEMSGHLHPFKISITKY